MGSIWLSLTHLGTFLLGFLLAWIFFHSIIKRYVKLLENIYFIKQTEQHYTNFGQRHTDNPELSE